MSELCEHYGVSRPTGYKWARRYEEEGVRGLEERSRAPRSCPHRTPREVEEVIVDLNRAVGFGARKLRRLLRGKLEQLPARSTVFDILKRHGLVRPRRRRRKWDHPGAVALRTQGPNEVWTADFKGHFRTRDGLYCYPLTVMDHYSRMLLSCQGLLSTRTPGARTVFEHLFREVGLPEAIRTDNGPPFASTGVHGLCALNVWWMKLGIVQQRITPRSPQENGAHERMHRTLKAATTRPPGSRCATQQGKFDSFREVYNHHRPHEALDDEVPASRWAPSRRPYPSTMRRPEYPGHFEVRRVSEAGCFRLHAGQVFLSRALRNEYLGLEEVDDGLWNLIFYRTLLARFDQRSNTITGASFRSEKC
jgi:transposase InsO family protein